jgi:hypothetical protein
MVSRIGRHRRPGKAAPVIRAARTTVAAGAVAAGAAAVSHSPAAAAAAIPRAGFTASYDVASAVQESVTVRPGDTLSVLAARHCGTPADWPGLYDANRGVIGNNDNIIIPGEVLVIRCARGPLPQERQHRPAATLASTAAIPTEGMSSFQQCVISRESGGNPDAQNPYSTASGLYGFLDTTWTAITGLPGPARDYSPAEQDAAFEKAYALDGTSPWRPYDGC